jgi:SAM-dependent methyltransferase
MLGRIRDWLTHEAATATRFNGHRIDHLSWQVDQMQRETRLLLSRLSLPDAAVWGTKPDLNDGAPAANAFPFSVVCRQEAFEQPYFRFWTRRLGAAFSYHRKLWEHVFICQALWERGALVPDARGLGFGVGREPLAALFAAEGCQVTGTDMEPESAAEKGWTKTAQHAAGLEALRYDHICPREDFDRLVKFKVCDMNNIQAALDGYDFCWSSCAFEHLGSIEQGLSFVERSLQCLRPGGWAVHTTEYNLSSNDHTLDQGGTVLFRQRDMEELARRLTAAGHEVAPLFLHPGQGMIDNYIDVPPYRPEPHLQLAIAGYACTSVGVIVRRSVAN